MRLAAALLCVTWLCASSAYAESEPGFVLQLQAPERSGCLDAAALTARLEARTGRAAQPASADPPLPVAIRIEPHGQGFRADLSIQGSQRELIAEGDCTELAEMLVVVIASSLGVAAVALKPSEKLSWPVEPPRAAAAPEPAVEAAPARPRPWQLEAAISARMLSGIMPQAAFAPALAVLAQSGAFGLHVGGTWLPSESYPLQHALALRATGAWGELGVCGRAAGGARLAALFCADLWGGAVRAAADPLRFGAARWDALAMLVPRAAGRLQLAPSFGIALGLGATIPLIFPRYTYGSASGDRVAGHAPELGLFVELALWLRIHS